MKHSPKTIIQDLYSGLMTSLFSIPEGMAYASIAGVNPIYGLFSAMGATIVSSLTTSSILMISTLTSAIAISTKSVINVANFESSTIPEALFTLTFLIGVVMLVLGVLRLGKIVNFVSNAAITGFIFGIAMLIIIGELGDLVGMKISGHNKLEEMVYWFTHIHEWDITTAIFSLLTIVLMFLLQKNRKTKEAASFIVLIGGVAVAYLVNLPSIALIGSISDTAISLPTPVVPNPILMPKLFVGAISIALLALVQGTSISTSFPNPDGSESNYSKDFIGQGLGNIFGSFFQSMGTGGSFSRTAISVMSGAKSNLSGIFSALWLILIVVIAGKLIALIPIATIGSILTVIAWQIMLRRCSDISLILRTSKESSVVMITTFLSSLFIPLQWTIFLGAILSLLFYIYASATKIRLSRMIKNKEGYFEIHDMPKKIDSGSVTVFDYEGNCFFGEVPAIKNMMPSIKEVKHSVIIWRMRGCEDIHSTFLKWLKGFIDQFLANDNRFMIEGVDTRVMKILEKTSIVEKIGKDNIFPAHPAYLMALEQALHTANTWIDSKKH